MTTLGEELQFLLMNPKDFYAEVITRSDPRVVDWLLMGSPLPTLFLIATYLTIVYFGPKFMRNRQAYSLKPLLVVYNFALVVLSAYIVYEALPFCFVEISCKFVFS